MDGWVDELMDGCVGWEGWKDKKSCIESIRIQNYA